MRILTTPSLERATIADAATVVRLRDAAAEWLLARGIEQWRPGEASEPGLAARAVAGELFVVRDRGEVVAAVVIVPSDAEIWGPRPADAGYVHTLVIDRRRAGEGLGRRVLARAEAHLAALGATYARLDCVAGNDGLTAYYRSAGFTEVGRRSFAPDRFRTPVALFEKRLEADPGNVAAASAAAAELSTVEVRRADAGDLASYRDATPADLVLMVGVFGNIGDDDIRRTVAALPHLCRPGATVIWTRSRRDPDLTGPIRAWFGDAGFAELAFDAPADALFSVGVHRLTRSPRTAPPTGRLFTFR